MNPIVSTSNVVKNYALGRVSVSALRGVTFDVARGEFLAIAGPSGSGKTTLLNLVGCVDTPSSGRVEVLGRPTHDLSDAELTRLRLFKIGFIFQSFNLVSALSAFQNVELPLLLQGQLSSRERRARCAEVLETVGIGEFARHRPSELSGGQRQRVAIARALVAKPDLVLADEPTANLDSDTGQQIVDLMKDLNRSQGTTFIFSTHDQRVMAHASTMVRMEDGRLVSPPAEAHASSAVLAGAVA